MHLRTIALLATTTAALAIPATAEADYGHVVLPGETLTSIAATDGLTISAVAAANGISPQTELIIGQVIEIPPQTQYTDAGSTTASSYSSSSSSTSTASAGNVSYIVQPGDTLSAIASRDDTTVSELAAVNGLNPSAYLLSGAVIALPVAGTGASSSSTIDGSTTEETAYESGQRQSSDTTSGPYPTPAYVSGSTIADIADASGVSPSLAQAIGWQESGWNNDVVSDTGAVGVMQIEPSTWSWIQQNLSGDSLSPDSAYDNVRGGVDLLHDLVSTTGSDSMAAAGYYQGLASIDEHGEYSSTQQYVADVMALQQRFGG
jgi:N-acetylmuramoyl-L-alanine amidase